MHHSRRNGEIEGRACEGGAAPRRARRRIGDAADRRRGGRARGDGEDGPTTLAVRETLGKAYFYATSLRKSNVATEDEWRPYAERTRQVFRYLAEHQDTAALADYERRVEAEFTRSVRQNSL